MTAFERPLPSLAATVAELLQLPAPGSAAHGPVAEVVAELGAAPQVALLAPDALGRYPFGLWRQEMPFLSGLHPAQPDLEVDNAVDHSCELHKMRYVTD